MLLHLFAVLVAASTAVLIFAGGMVTSTGSGLSVPDWPNTYGWFMFTFPLEKWVGGIFYEHTHRLIASTVGFLIVVLAFWLWRAEPRRWVRRLGFIALGAVITQGVLGGITVLWLPAGPDLDRPRRPRANRVLPHGDDRARHVARMEARRTRPRRHRRVRRPHAAAMALVTTALIYVQILIGATMRHTDAGLAIPDFPLAFGQLVPPHWDAKIAIHFAHRVGALIASVPRCWRRRCTYSVTTVAAPELRAPSTLLLCCCRSRSRWAH